MSNFLTGGSLKELSYLRVIFILLTLLIHGCATKGKYDFLTVPKVDTKNTKRYESFSHKNMIVSQNPKSTQAGLKILELGGNLVDAFAAVSFAISVERPQSTGIGGGGFMVANGPLFKGPVSLDFRERASKKAHKELFLDQNKSSLYGAHAIAIPGLVKGVIEIHKQYGKLPLSIVMAPAIEMAKKGIKVDKHLASALKENADSLKKDPEMIKVFFKDQEVLEENDIVVQDDLAKTLMLISKTSGTDFYQGETAKKIVETINDLGGILSLEDLELYRTHRRKVMTGKFLDYQIYTMGPPSSGGTHLIQILNMVEKLKLNKVEPFDPENIHKIASAMQLAFVDRALYMGDPDFVKIPLKTLTSKDYAKQLAEQISEKAIPSSSVNSKIKVDFKESDDTTHFSLADDKGNVISSTQTINGLFGAHMMVKGTGIILNNEMDDFARKPGDTNLFGAVGSDKNLPDSLKTPLSSMTPALIYHQNQPVMVLGTPSGTRIITCVANVILNYLFYEIPLYESVALARYHHQWYPEEIRFDEIDLNKKLTESLKLKGHNLRMKNLGCQVEAISFEAGGALHGVSDPRGEGLAQGH